ncbi:hypothetical protein HDV00_004897 [Rhizophlyctis rosea]|nr:hypothetical protein HDV00_004897 [Rhizophlyctis rosea]
MKPPLLPLLLPLLVTTLLLGQVACAGNFLSMTVSNKFYNWGWANVSYVTSTPPTLPSDIIFPTTVYYVHQNNWQNNPSVMDYQDGNQQAMRWHNTDVPWVVDAGGAPYGTVTILIYPMNNYCNGLYFSFLVNGGNTWTNANAFNPPFKSLQDYNNGNPVTLNQWYRVTLDLAQAYSLAATANGANKSITDMLVWDPSNVHDGATYYVMAYLGDEANYVPPPVAPRYKQGPVYDSAGQIVKMTADGETFLSQGTDPTHPDYGLIPQWACSDQTVRRGYADLLGIPVNAFRDTEMGTVAMNLSAGTYYQDSTLFIRNMWIRPTDGINHDGYYDFNAWDFPHPAYTCMIYNADSYVVGDPTIANETLQNLYLAAWADYVKAKKTGGVNVAVNIRQKFYPYTAIRGWAAVPEIAANCTEGAPKWLCPDIIFFSDAELGVLKEQQNRLLPLTDPVLNYFRETGFEPSMDMEAVVKSLVYFNNVPYALPAHVVSRGWGVNVAMLNKYNLKLPPPLSDWGSAWWTNWNMKKFNEYLTTMWEGGESALFVLPPYEGTQTILSAKMNLLWGGSLFTPDGRCGMDERTELGLNQTIMYWKSKPGMLQYPQPSDPAELAKWIAEPLQDNPMNMWLPNFVHPSWVGPWVSQGFDEYHCYPYQPSACQSIYPPTGSAYVSAVLAGIPTSTHNITKSYEALVIAIATNERLGVNAPQEASGVRGMSAWKTTRYAPELIAKPKTFAITLLDHATFGGYPAEQKPGWSEVFKYDPMELAFAEILYKNLTARQAMERACYTVQWASRPPCTQDQWKVSVIDNTGNNKGTVNFTWVDGVDNICRTDLITTAALPAPIPKYMASTKIYNTSTIGRAILAVSLLGILIEVGLIAGFLWYRKADVIKAAAVTPSLLILGGGFLLGLEGGSLAGRRY